MVGNGQQRGRGLGASGQQVGRELAAGTVRAPKVGTHKTGTRRQSGPAERAGPEGEVHL